MRKGDKKKASRTSEQKGCELQGKLVATTIFRLPITPCYERCFLVKGHKHQHFPLLQQAFEMQQDYKAFRLKKYFCLSQETPIPFS